MAITDLFKQTVTLVRTTAYELDEIGGVSSDTTSSTEIQAYLEPRTGTEDLADRGSLIGDWLMAVPAGTDLTGWDRVTYMGHTFDVLGPAKPFFDPRSESEHHIEVELREVV